MVDPGDEEQTGNPPIRPSAASVPPAPTAEPTAPRAAWSRPGDPLVDTEAVTTELPRGAYPAPAAGLGDVPPAPGAAEPVIAPPVRSADAPLPAGPGSLPSASPFAAPASPPPDPPTTSWSPPDPPVVPAMPVAWAPPPDGGAPVPRWDPAASPHPHEDPAHAGAAEPDAPADVVGPDRLGTAHGGHRPARPDRAGSSPDHALPQRASGGRRQPLVEPRITGSGIPSGPPEYDPARFGPLGASGGVPLLPDTPGREPAPQRGSSMRAAVLVGVLSAVIASLITGGLFVALTDDPVRDIETATDRGPAPTLVAPLDIYELLEKAQPSVVSIRTDVTSSSGTTPFGAGSGVIISEDGLVLTNAHVIAGSSTMRVTLHDGHEQDATLVGSFPDDDIALIRLAEPNALTPAVLGSSADIVVGDPVVAIGNALNLGGPPSVTEGIVSAKDRNIQTSEGTLRNLIQTDAAINPGNSGGPLLNASGQVVGINTAIIDDAQNIGFAISIDLLKPLIEDLKEGRGDITPESPFLGVSTQTLGDVTDATLERYGVTATDGAFVSDVVPGSGAADAGLQPGDVVTAIDGEPVTSSTDVGAIIRNREAGEMITIEIERKGEPQTLTATLKSRGETGN